MFTRQLVRGLRYQKRSGVAEPREIVYLVGPSRETNGGIGYVIGTLLDSGLLNQYHLIHIVTHRDGNRFAKGWVFVKALLKFVFLKLTKGGRLVHIHSGYGPSLARKALIFLIGRWLGCRILFQIHSGHIAKYHEESSQAVKGLINRILRDADGVIALTDSLRDEIVSLNTQHAPIHVVGNPIDTKLYRQVPAKGPRSTTHRLLFLGAIIKPKGVYDVIECMRRLVAEGLTLSLTMAGDREIEQAKLCCQNAGLEGIIRFPGWVSRSQKLELLASSELLLLPSYTEGLPLCVLEAMACGLPIVCTGVGGLQDVVIHGENGFVIEPGNIDALAFYTRLLLSDESLRRSMGQNNVKKISRCYGVDVISEKLGLLYYDLTKVARDNAEILYPVSKRTDL